MCKYCAFTYIDKEIGEQSNEDQKIVLIQDGSHKTELSINRYQNDDGVEFKELVLCRSVENAYAEIVISEEHINIAYCPFCGEKL